MLADEVTSVTVQPASVRLPAVPHAQRRVPRGWARDNLGMADLVIKLLPILHLADPDAERHFYERLRLRTTYEGPEYPGFIAVGNDAVEFELSRRPGTDPAAPGFTWQLGVRD
jgi:hypothetical protein